VALTQRFFISFDGMPFY